ncbi:unnamed protein product [Xylocopa violacea]|uniref:Rad51-like C-terminal domain-containing protein n=1 Tax=Xylocopa violacea TaxID=135666 RepID=A0ABP1P3H6_XYLVO
MIDFKDEDAEKLATFTGLSLKDILQIKQNIFKKYGGTVQNAFHLFETERNNIIPTKISRYIRSGGLYPGHIYEICGLSASGKTQLCFAIATNVALEPHNCVRYIDTKRDFCGSRIEQILVQKGCSKQVINETMERIKVCSIYNLHQLFKVLRWLTVNLREESERCRTRTIIIDCLPAIIFQLPRCYRPITAALNHLANICHSITKEFNLSIISVNLITQWNEEGPSTSSNENCSEVTPTLGKYWTHVPNTRLLLEKVRPGSRKLSIWKSSQVEEKLSCNLRISDSGILCC